MPAQKTTSSAANQITGRMVHVCRKSGLGVGAQPELQLLPPTVHLLPLTLHCTRPSIPILMQRQLPINSTSSSSSSPKRRTHPKLHTWYSSGVQLCAASVSDPCSPLAYPGAGLLLGSRSPNQFLPGTPLLFPGHLLIVRHHHHPSILRPFFPTHDHKFLTSAARAVSPQELRGLWMPRTRPAKLLLK